MSADARIAFRIESDRKKRWEECAAGTPMSQFIIEIVEASLAPKLGGILEFIATNVKDTEPALVKAQVADSPAPEPEPAADLQCEREQHHRRGMFCKSCGKIGA